MGLLFKGGYLMTKGELELLQRRLEAELVKHQAKRDNFENGLSLLRKEVARTNDRIDELTRELIFVIEQLRKF
jgi:hypothetical protein